MEALLNSAGATPTGDINTVRNQIKLVRSGAFQLLGEFPTDPTTFLTRAVGECLHVSNTEFIPPNGPQTGPQEVYHYQGTAVPADYWSVTPAKPSTYKFKNQAYGSWLHADANIKTPSGKLNVYAARNDPDDGNNFVVEPSGGGDWHKTGYFRLKSTVTHNYVFFSDKDLTPNGKKEVCQIANAADAAVLYIF